MKQSFTPVVEKHGRWHTAYVEEITGVNTLCRTRAAVRRNLKEALQLIQEENRQLRRQKAAAP